MQVTDRITADEYLGYEGARRTWLVDGEIVVNQPRLMHQMLHGGLFRALDDWTRAGEDRGLLTIPIDVELDEHNVYAPDLLWYDVSRAPAFVDDPPYPLPDLAVEIRSPSTWRYDVGTKKRVYEAHGLPELWLVDSDAAVLLVYRRSAPAAATFDLELEFDGTATLATPLLPGFALDVGALFDFG